MIARARLITTKSDRRHRHSKAPTILFGCSYFPSTDCERAASRSSGGTGPVAALFGAGRRWEMDNTSPSLKMRQHSETLTSDMLRSLLREVDAESKTE